MPSSPRSPEPPDLFDVLQDKDPTENESWPEDGDPLPAGWEDWSELEASGAEEQDSMDWTDLECEPPATVVGYRARAVLVDLDEMQIDAFCDTGSLSPGSWCRMSCSLQMVSPWAWKKSTVTMPCDCGYGSRV